MVKGLSYTTHCLWFSYNDKKEFVGVNAFGACSMYIRDQFKQYKTVELYIPDDYLKHRYSIENINNYVTFLGKCGFKIEYKGISEDWKDEYNRYSKDGDIIKFAKNSKYINNPVFHKFIFKANDYTNKLHIMGGFVCLRYLYCSYFEGLVEDIMKLNNLFPRTNAFKVLLLAHYSPTYRKEINKGLICKWGLVALYNKYGNFSSGRISTPILGSKAFKLITTAQFIKNTKKTTVNLNSSVTILKEDILVEDIAKLFDSEDYTKIKKLLK